LFSVVSLEHYELKLPYQISLGTSLPRLFAY